MKSNTTTTVGAARGGKIVKSTGLDNSSHSAGKEVSQLKRSDFGGSKSNLSHSISSGSVASGK